MHYLKSLFQCRATTEFTGWPTPSTTPISIEKLLEAARTATVSSINSSMIPTTSEASTTPSTTTTTTTVRPTTPGYCTEECEVAGTIRIIGNTTWVPELFDRNTREWQDLANEVEKEVINCHHDASSRNWSLISETSDFRRLWQEMLFVEN